MHAAMRHKGVVPIHISAARLPLCLNAPQPARAMRARTSVPSQTRLPVAHATDARVRYNAKLQRDSVGPSNDVPVTLTVNISQRAQSGDVRLSQEDCTELLRALGILATVYPTMSSVGVDDRAEVSVTIASKSKDAALSSVSPPNGEATQADPVEALPCEGLNA